MNEQTLALLTNRLELPLALREVIEQNTPFSGDMIYTFHSMLSDMRPDTGLLAIAVSARMIVSSMKKPTPGDAVLHGLCSRVMEDYAPRWLATYGQEDAVHGSLLEIFSRVEADLLILHDLLKTASALQKDEKLSQALHILEIQSKAQADVVAEFLNLMECEFMQGENMFPPQKKLVFREMDEEYSEFEMDACRYDTPAGLKAQPSNVVNFPLY